MNVIDFPTEEPNRQLVERWLYAQLKSFPQGEAFARQWSRELRGAVRTRPENVEKMRRDLATGFGS